MTSFKLRKRQRTKARLHNDSWQPWPRPDARFAVKKAFCRDCPQFPRVNLEIMPTRKRMDDKCSLVFLSDLHWNGKMAEEYEMLTESINALDADWIVFGGDLSVYMDSVDGALEWLSRLKAKRGKLAILGNRESPVFWLGKDDWKEVYATAGFELLCNQSYDGGNLLFYGVDDRRYGSPDWMPLHDDPRPVISFSHNPDAVADASDKTFVGDLVLCGHTHGGQLCLPFFGPFYTSSYYGRQFFHGLQQRRDGTLCLTASGVGESGFGFFHRRICCPREFVYLNIM